MAGAAVAQSQCSKAGMYDTLAGWQIAIALCNTYGALRCEIWPTLLEHHALTLQIRRLKEEVEARGARVGQLERVLRARDREFARLGEEREKGKAAERERAQVGWARGGAQIYTLHPHYLLWSVRCDMLCSLLCGLLCGVLCRVLCGVLCGMLCDMLCGLLCGVLCRVPYGVQEGSPFPLRT